MSFKQFVPAESAQISFNAKIDLAYATMVQRQWVLDPLSAANLPLSLELKDVATDQWKTNTSAMLRDMIPGQRDKFEKILLKLESVFKKDRNILTYGERISFCLKTIEDIAQKINNEVGKQNLQEQLQLPNEELFLACKGGDVDTVRILLDMPLLYNLNIYINVQTKLLGETPLYIACMKGYVEVVKLLLSKEGIYINKPTKIGETPLYIACMKGYVEVVKLLLDRDDIDVNLSPTIGETPLFIASTVGHTAVVKLLLDRDDIDVNTSMQNGMTPLKIATKNKHTEIAKLLSKSLNMLGFF
jgi:ankyrin repeat protein